MYMRNINDNAVCLSENYMTGKIITWNILDTKYLRFTVMAAFTLTAFAIIQGKPEWAPNAGVYLYINFIYLFVRDLA